MRGCRGSATPALGEELARWAWPVVAFESPQRLPRTLAALAHVIPERACAVCRELTKRYEEIARGTVAELAARFREPVRGEVTLVLGAAAPLVAHEEGAIAAVGELVAAGVARRQAAEVVARLTGVSRNILYRRSL
jgi:16S rRNA (cytidine1402-2'-O)-methyltransferase